MQPTKLQRLLFTSDILIIIAFALVPLFSTFPYRVNIFLSWEGAYRISQGQTPFQDFGLPMGYMFWVVPAFFFKIFGPGLVTLVKAQVFINILSGLAFRSMLKSLQVQPGLRLAGVLLFCLSFSFFNFWPWYNHTVIVYEFVALALLLKAITSQNKLRLLWFAAGGAFLFISFFTKQDGGGMAIMIGLALIGYASIADKKWWYLPAALAGIALAAAFFLLPLRGTDFGYWFNHGQPPHNSRLSAFDIVDEFFTNSQWIKFYLFIILLLMLPRLLKWKQLWADKMMMLFFLLTVGILAEASIFQITSYTPPDNNIFFHSFAAVFILQLLGQRMADLNFNSIKTITVVMAGMLLWWSGTYWKYINRIVSRANSGEQTAAAAVGRNTYMIKSDTSDVPMSKWIFSNRKGFEKIYMPPSTVEGIERVMKMDAVTKPTDKPRRILNFTELTPLILEMKYEQDRGIHIPLWHHRGVAMFDRETKLYTDRVHNKYYDLVLFEYMPKLNNFFPFEVRDSLLTNYELVDSFHAPRRPTDTWIEVFVPKHAAKDSSATSPLQ
ncbi:hypothetical protein [Phnomibacter ginsenosidimutans]|uniref:Glycosyltransferase RgtA/B/C/D-like domain-containing protein n=1 Tax=Phnomibacter ginsenosidimutans TaxID=2676868 RepID=A0A6I6GK69_9BACT|nr:hypothetical protein [Phnomibacter ginsenosidimutans]QGW28008.1 hypothetical protein GLV81_07760 [Phnomibacter ginsenosidimutans]